MVTSTGPPPPSFHHSHRKAPPLTKKEMAKRFCYGVVITSVWVATNGVLWWGFDAFRNQIKFVEDYGGDLTEDDYYTGPIGSTFEEYDYEDHHGYELENGEYMDNMEQLDGILV